MKVSLCGQADCPTPYEFCEACVRADERGRFRESMELAEAEVRSHKDRWADLRGKVEALPTVGGVTMPYVKGAEHRYEMVYRDDVLALFGGGQR